jgi:hypothetical protein
LIAAHVAEHQRFSLPVRFSGVGSRVGIVLSIAISSLFVQRIDSGERYTLIAINRRGLLVREQPCAI